MGDGVAISEPGGNFLEVNRVVCERLGYTREQLLAMPVGAINSPESAATIPKRVEAMLRGGRVGPSRRRTFDETERRYPSRPCPVASSSAAGRRS